MPGNHNRSHWNDYRERNIYMITLATHDRRPVLGSLAGGIDDARIALSPTGAAVEQAWRAMNKHYPQVEGMTCQVMPDHYHGVLYVHQRLPVHLGLPVILLRENGFAPLAKPAGRLMEAYAAGRLLLIVAPWPHHTARTAITRDQCNNLNELAREICALTTQEMASPTQPKPPPPA